MPCPFGFDFPSNIQNFLLANRWPHSVILGIEGPNDGLVSVSSSKWGTYLGTLQQVNHLDLVGWINTARYKWAEMFGKEIGFRPATFYLGVADLLAREVEGQGRNGDEEETDADEMFKEAQVILRMERERERGRQSGGDTSIHTSMGTTTTTTASSNDHQQQSSTSPQQDPNSSTLTHRTSTSTSNSNDRNNDKVSSSLILDSRL